MACLSAPSRGHIVVYIQLTVNRVCLQMRNVKVYMPHNMLATLCKTMSGTSVAPQDISHFAPATHVDLAA